MRSQRFTEGIRRAIEISQYPFRPMEDDVVLLRHAISVSRGVVLPLQLPAHLPNLLHSDAKLKLSDGGEHRAMIRVYHGVHEAKKSDNLNPLFFLWITAI